MAGEPLPAADTAWAMGEIMDGAATGVQIAGFVVALRCKGETAAEVDGFVSAMLERAVPLPLAERWRSAAVDTCGTGGDRARHGQHLHDGRDRRRGCRRAGRQARQPGRVVAVGLRRSAGSAGHRDRSRAGGRRPMRGAGRHRILLRTALPPGAASRGRCPQRARRADGLQHPRAAHQPGTGRPVRRSACRRPGSDRCWPGCWRGADASALVFRGDDGLDELTPGARSEVWVVAAAQVREDELNPADLGLPAATVDELRGGDAVHNARGGPRGARRRREPGRARGGRAQRGCGARGSPGHHRRAGRRAAAPGARAGAGGAGSGEGLDVLQRWAKVSNA